MAFLFIYLITFTDAIFRGGGFNDKPDEDADPATLCVLEQFDPTKDIYVISNSTKRDTAWYSLLSARTFRMRSDKSFPKDLWCSFTLTMNTEDVINLTINKCKYKGLFGITLCLYEEGI